MAYRRGEVVLVKYPYTNLTASKARPAMVVSGSQYQMEQPDLMLAALTTNVGAANGSLDYLLQDWQAANLRFPTALKPLIATLEPALIVHHLGFLTAHDLAEVESRLRLTLEL